LKYDLPYSPHEPFSHHRTDLSEQIGIRCSKRFTGNDLLQLAIEPQPDAVSIGIRRRWRQLIERNGKEINEVSEPRSGAIYASE